MSLRLHTSLERSSVRSFFVGHSTAHKKKKNIKSENLVMRPKVVVVTKREPTEPESRGYFGGSASRPFRCGVFRHGAGAEDTDLHW